MNERFQLLQIAAFLKSDCSWQQKTFLVGDRPTFEEDDVLNQLRDGSLVCHPYLMQTKWEQPGMDD